MLLIRTAHWSRSFHGSVTMSGGTGNPVSYSQSGPVVDVEAVTVPAGTFVAIKLQSTVTWTGSGGTTRTQTITNWRGLAAAYSVKQTPVDRGQWYASVNGLRGEPEDPVGEYLLTLASGQTVDQFVTGTVK
jgi:hypothetical protein